MVEYVSDELKGSEMIWFFCNEEMFQPETQQQKQLFSFDLIRSPRIKSHRSFSHGRNVAGFGIIDFLLLLMK